MPGGSSLWPASVALLLTRHRTYNVSCLRRVHLTANVRTSCLWLGTFLPPDRVFMETADPRCDVAILANPIAGSGSSARLLDELVDKLKVGGLRPTLCPKPEELPLLSTSLKNSLRCIIAAGGDGTLGAVLNHAPGVPVSILPVGNENLVAKLFGFHKSACALADTVLHGQTRRLDLGMANDRFFAAMIGIGFEAEVVRRVHQDRRGHVNKLNYALAILNAARAYPFSEIEIDIEETGESLCGAMALAFNLPTYPLGLPIADQADPSDGLLDLFVFRRPGVRSLLRYIYAVSRGKQTKLADLQHRRVRRIHVRSAGRVPIQIDGDPAGFLPVTIQAVPGAWQVLAPRLP